ncbi:MAG TPA: alpha/beta fold hydrolase [Puia sp.]|nr:alpha/beta fold hydrolase [Puia sp.]
MKQFLILYALIIVFTNKMFAQQNSFSEKTISVPFNSCTIEGTLLIPDKNSKQLKLAIIVAGSGPTDRNGNSILGVSANSYKILAEELAKQGIASFRYDKRGIGKSVPKNFTESNLVFEDYINDITAIFDCLKDSLGYKNIYLIGHSEGSLTGMVASQRRPMKGYISLSGAGRSIDVVIEEQIKSQPAFVRDKVDSIFLSLKAGKKVDSVPAFLYSLFRPSVQPYMISWLKYNPVAEIGKLKCPVLIIQGICDMQVKMEDANNLHEANKKSRLDIILSMTHTLKNAGENCVDDGQKTYHDATLPLNKQLVIDVVHFIIENN